MALMVENFKDQFKKLFQSDGVILDNVLFQLHHKYSFVILLTGLLFIAGQNYLNTDAITCIEDNSYIRNFCFVHGAAHIPDDVQKYLSSGGTRCTAETKNEPNTRTTNYYIWLPFVLTICAVVTKFPRIIWKNVFERGVMQKLVKDATEDNGEIGPSRFNKVVIEKVWISKIYNYGFAFCEILNIVAILINMGILDHLLNGQFFNYGLEWRYKKHPNNLEESEINHLCKVFPTEVSCTVFIGAITGSKQGDMKNTLCLLSNNVFNQYFFLILWFWWFVLLLISGLGTVYRIVQICLPGTTRTRLTAHLDILGVGQTNVNKVTKLQLSPSELFVFTRLVFNLKGSQVDRVIEGLPENRNEGYLGEADKAETAFLMKEVKTEN